MNTSRGQEEDKFLTLYPQGKKGVRIDKGKYDVMKAAILKALKGSRILTHTELFRAAESYLPAGFKGSKMWYFETVKLDLEARRSVERLKDSEPPRYRLKDA